MFSLIFSTEITKLSLQAFVVGLVVPHQKHLHLSSLWSMLLMTVIFSSYDDKAEKRGAWCSPRFIWVPYTLYISKIGHMKTNFYMSNIAYFYDERLTWYFFSSEDVRELGFSVVIDMRGNSSWSTVKPILKVHLLTLINIWTSTMVKFWLSCFLVDIPKGLKTIALLSFANHSIIVWL